MFKRYMLKVMGSQPTETGRIVMPHLYLTYMMIGLTASVVHELFGKQVVWALFSWYYANGLHNYLMSLGLLSYTVRSVLVNNGVLR